MDKLVLVSKNPSLLFFRLILYLAIFVCLAQNLFYCVSWNISIRYLLDPWLPPLQLCRAICGQLSRAKTKPETFFPEKKYCNWENTKKEKNCWGLYSYPANKATRPKITNGTRSPYTFKLTAMYGAIMGLILAYM